MTTLSLVLPDTLAKASQKAAMSLGISRTQFIRQAIAHELQNLQAQLEQEAIAKSILAMKKDKKYLKEAKELDGLDTNLPQEEEKWWDKNKS